MAYLKTKAEYKAELKSAGDKLLAIDFTATWCGPCQAIGPKFEAMQSEFPDVIFKKIDVDENQETSQKLKVTAMPPGLG